MERNNVNIQVYSSCNCDCEFCHFKDKENNKINPQFVLNYLKDNPHINYIVLTGGEPTFAIDECVEIIKGVNKNAKKVVLQTNGWWGENEEIKEKIKSNPPSVVHLSVDSEKQKIIPIEMVLKAYQFLIENNIETYVVNHTESEKEYEYYKTKFNPLKRGSIVYDDGTSLYSCGTALLATNEESSLNIKGWGGGVNG